MLKLIESILVFALSSLVANYGDKVDELFRRVGDKLNDKIEGTETELDDIAKAKIVAGLNILAAELSVEGVDG